MTTTRPGITTPPDTLEPDPGAITGLFTGLTFAAAIVGATKLAKGPIPRPGAPAAAIREYYHHSARRPVQRGRPGHLNPLPGPVHRHGGAASSPRDARVAAAAGNSGHQRRRFGGVARDLGRHARLADHPTRPRRRNDDQAGPADVHRRRTVHGVAYGIFTAVLATTARRTGLVGRAAAATGLVSAATGILSPLYFRWENAGWLIPIGRFSGYILAGMTGVRLAGARQSRPA